MLSGNVIFAFSQWGIVIALAKIAGAESLGVYAFAQAITSPIFSFAGLGLRPALATDVDSQYSLSSYLGLNVLVSLIAFSLCVGGAVIGGASSLAFLAIVALAIARTAENSSFLAYALFQRFEKVEKVSRSLIFRGVAGFSGFLFLLEFSRGRVDVAITALAASWVLVFLLHDLPGSLHLYKRSRKGGDASLTVPNIREVGKLFMKVSPLGILVLITSLTLNMPRYFIENHFGVVALGYFAAIVQLANIGAIVVNSVGQTILPRLAEYYISQRIAYVRLLIKAVTLAGAIGGSGVIVAVLLGEPLLATIYTSDFGEHNITLIVAMVWSATLYISATLGCGLTAIRSFRSQAIIGGISMFTTLVSCWILIKQYGITGAAIALLIGSMSKLIGQLVMLYFLITQKTV